MFNFQPSFSFFSPIAGDEGTSLILFTFSPFVYAYISISNKDKRTDYPGKQIAIKTQYVWDQDHKEIINVVLGDEWTAGNLSYHLKSRPVWEGPVTKDKLNSLSKFTCIDNICIGVKKIN